MGPFPSKNGDFASCFDLGPPHRLRDERGADSDVARRVWGVQMLKLPEGRALLLPCGWLTATHAFLLLLLAHGLDSLPQECHHPRLDHAACSGQSGLRGGAPDAGPESPILSSYTPCTSQMSTVDGARGVGRNGSDRHTPGWLGRT